MPCNKFVMDQDVLISASFLYLVCMDFDSVLFHEQANEKRIISSDRDPTLGQSGTLWKVHGPHAQPPSLKVGTGAVERWNIVLSFVKFEFFIVVRGCWLASKERGHQWRQQLKCIMSYPLPRYSTTKVTRGTSRRQSRNLFDLNLQCTSAELPRTWRISDLSGLNCDQAFAD